MQGLERQLEQKTAQLAVLREIGRAINAAWELEATLDLITRRTADVVGMDSCSICLLDPRGESLVLKATTGLEIIETLVREDLEGEGSLAGNDGTTARITIPVSNGVWLCAC